MNLESEEVKEREEERGNSQEPHKENGAPTKPVIHPAQPSAHEQHPLASTWSYDPSCQETEVQLYPGSLSMFPDHNLYLKRNNSIFVIQ